ncbi:hypothetical protein NEIPOLOT_02028 [Neisseria polysaccharea ATCC 43768]|nr:hypothetical protein NEIPOLOT_02028 [Neisseria polysaccharea ATCC 43768]
MKYSGLNLIHYKFVIPAKTEKQKPKVPSFPRRRESVFLSLGCF